MKWLVLGMVIGLAIGIFFHCPQAMAKSCDQWVRELNREHYPGISGWARARYAARYNIYAEQCLGRWHPVDKQRLMDGSSYEYFKRQHQRNR